MSSKKGGKKPAGKGKATSKGKGKGKGKGTGEVDENDPELIIKDFLRTYDKTCKAHNAPISASIVQEFKKLLNDEEEELTEKRISFPLIVSEPVGAEGTKALLESLVLSKYSKYYYWLGFWRANVGDEGTAALAEFLKKDCLVRTLELMDNHVSPKGCIALRGMIKNNETLKTLILDYNDIGDEGAEALGEGLKWNTGLETLSLRYCNIGPEGGVSIGKDIVGYSKLKSLDLQGNAIGSKGVIAISEALRRNDRLESINLADNCFGHDMLALESLRAGLEENNTLKDVNLHLNSMLPEGVTMLLAVLKNKKNIQEFKIYERIDKEIFADLMDTVKSHKSAVTGGKKGKKGGKGKKKGGKKKK